MEAIIDTANVLNVSSPIKAESCREASYGDGSLCSPVRADTTPMGTNSQQPRGILRISSWGYYSSSTISSPVSRCGSTSVSTATSSADTADKRTYSGAKRSVTFLEEPNVHEYELPSDESIRSHSIHELRQGGDGSGDYTFAPGGDICSNQVSERTDDNTSKRKRGPLRKVERKSKTKCAPKGKYDYRKWVAGVPATPTKCPSQGAQLNNPALASPSPATGQAMNRQLSAGSRRASRLMMAALSGAATLTGLPAPSAGAVSMWKRGAERGGEGRGGERPSVIAASVAPNTCASNTTPSLPAFSSPSRQAVQTEQPASATEPAAKSSPSSNATSMTSPDRCASPPSSPSDADDYALAFLRRRKLAKKQQGDGGQDTEDAPLPDFQAEADNVPETAEARRNEMRFKEALLDSYPRMHDNDGEVYVDHEEAGDQNGDETDSTDNDPVDFGSPNTEPADSSFEETTDIEGTARQLAEEDEFQCPDGNATDGKNAVGSPTVTVRMAAVYMPSEVLANIEHKTCYATPLPSDNISCFSPDRIMASPCHTNLLCVSPNLLDSTLTEISAKDSTSPGCSESQRGEIGSPSLLTLRSPDRSVLTSSAIAADISSDCQPRVLSTLELLVAPEGTREELSPSAAESTAPPPFQIGDAVIVNFSPRVVYNGTVHEVNLQKAEAFIRYDGFPLSRGEWKGFSLLEPAATGQRTRRSRLQQLSPKRKRPDTDDTETRRNRPRLN